MIVQKLITKVQKISNYGYPKTWKQIDIMSRWREGIISFKGKRYGNK